MRGLNAIAALAVSTLISIGIATAQSERGTITGVVHDASGAVVPDAKVAVVNQATKVSLEGATNEAGEYTMPNLQPGTYNVTVTKAGFRTSSVAGLVLNATQTLRADATDRKSTRLNSSKRT